MSKVTIRFWDKARSEYADSAWLAITDEGDIYDMHRESEGLYESLIDIYEAHFYKDGERIDG